MSSLWIFFQQERNYSVACISLMCKDMFKGNLLFFFCDLFILHLDVLDFFKSAYFRPFVFLICYSSSHCWLSLELLSDPPAWTPCFQTILTQHFALSHWRARSLQNQHCFPTCNPTLQLGEISYFAHQAYKALIYHIPTGIPFTGLQPPPRPSPCFLWLACTLLFPSEELCMQASPATFFTGLPLIFRTARCHLKGAAVFNHHDVPDCSRAVGSQGLLERKHLSQMRAFVSYASVCPASGMVPRKTAVSVYPKPVKLLPIVLHLLRFYLM